MLEPSIAWLKLIQDIIPDLHASDVYFVWSQLWAKCWYVDWSSEIALEFHGLFDVLLVYPFEIHCLVLSLLYAVTVRDLLLWHEGIEFYLHRELVCVYERVRQVHFFLCGQLVAFHWVVALSARKRSIFLNFAEDNDSWVLHSFLVFFLDTCVEGLISTVSVLMDIFTNINGHTQLCSCFYLF